MAGIIDPVAQAQMALHQQIVTSGLPQEVIREQLQAAGFIQFNRAEEEVKFRNALIHHGKTPAEAEAIIAQAGFADVVIAVAPAALAVSALSSAKE